MGAGRANFPPLTHMRDMLWTSSGEERKGVARYSSVVDGHDLWNHYHSYNSESKKRTQF